jgi:hypothetical protein
MFNIRSNLNGFSDFHHGMNMGVGSPSTCDNLPHEKAKSQNFYFFQSFFNLLNLVIWLKEISND